MLDHVNAWRKWEKGLEMMWGKGGVMKPHGSLGSRLHLYGNYVTAPLSPSIDLSIRFWLCNKFSTKPGLRYSRSCQPLASSTAASAYTRGSGVTKTGRATVPEPLLYSLIHFFAKKWPERSILLKVNHFWMITESWLWFRVVCVLHCVGVEQPCAAQNCRSNRKQPRQGARGREKETLFS